MSEKEGEVRAIAEELAQNVVSKKRSYHLESFENCFVASEAVTYLVSNGKRINLVMRFVD